MGIFDAFLSGCRSLKARLYILEVGFLWINPVLMRIIVLLFFTTFTMACSSFRETNRMGRKTLPHYAKSDTLYLSDYILCYSRKSPQDELFSYSAKTRVSPINEDSVFAILAASFQSLNLPLRIDSVNVNRCNARFHRNYPPKVWKMKKSIREIARSTGHPTVVIPFVRLEERWHIILRGYPNPDANLSTIVLFQLGIFVVSQNEIVYISNYLLSKDLNYQEHRDTYPVLTQEDWDAMLRAAMGAYMSRLK